MTAANNRCLPRPRSHGTHFCTHCHAAPLHRALLRCASRCTAQTKKGDGKKRGNAVDDMLNRQPRAQLDPTRDTFRAADADDDGDELLVPKAKGAAAAAASAAESDDDGG